MDASDDWKRSACKLFNHCCVEVNKALSTGYYKDTKHTHTTADARSLVRHLKTCPAEDILFIARTFLPAQIKAVHHIFRIRGAHKWPADADVHGGSSILAASIKGCGSWHKVSGAVWDAAFDGQFRRGGVTRMAAVMLFLLRLNRVGPEAYGFDNYGGCAWMDIRDLVNAHIYNVCPQHRHYHESHIWASEDRGSAEIDANYLLLARTVVVKRIEEAYFDPDTELHRRLVAEPCAKRMRLA